jgi:hypothetical protein
MNAPRNNVVIVSSTGTFRTRAPIIQMRDKGTWVEAGEVREDGDGDEGVDAVGGAVVVKHPRHHVVGDLLLRGRIFRSVSSRTAGC